MDHEAFTDLCDERFVMMVCGFFSLSARKSTSMEATSVQ